MLSNDCGDGGGWGDATFDMTCVRSVDIDTVDDHMDICQPQMG